MMNPVVALGGAALILLLLIGATGAERAAQKLQSPPRRVPPMPVRTDPVFGQPGRYFSWAELTRSGTATRLGIDNTPDPASRTRLIMLTAAILDPLRETLGVPINVHDAYRSATLNEHIPGAAEDSQHMLGEAADLSVEGYTSQQLARIILASGIPFDQLIWYSPERGGHLHISYTERRANRYDTRWAPPDTGTELPWKEVQ